jgi:hypothetical protein
MPEWLLTSDFQSYIMPSASAAGLMKSNGATIG